MNIFNYNGFSFETIDYYCSLCTREIYQKYGEMSNEFYEDCRINAWKKVLHMNDPREWDRRSKNYFYLCEDCLEQILMRMKRN